MPKSMNTPEPSDARAEAAFRDGLAGYSASAPVPELSSGLAAITGSAEVLDTAPLTRRPGVRTDAPGPVTLRAAGRPSTAPGSSRRKLSVGFGLAAVTIVALIIGSPFVFRALTPRVAAIPAGSPTVSSLPSGDPTDPDDSAFPPCPDGVNPPDGVTRAVCGGAPADAEPAPRFDRTLPADFPETGYRQSFRTPSGNIVCSLWYRGDGNLAIDEPDAHDGVDCDIKEWTFAEPTAMPDSMREECLTGNDVAGWAGQEVDLSTEARKGACRSENSTGIHQGGTNDLAYPALEDGASYVGGTIACTSEAEAVTCWNTETHHGFKLSKSVQLTW